jgi:quercetin dioxygenase-like cupin family protein
MYEEPKDEQQVAGTLRLQLIPSPYERFMREQDIPIYRGMGIRDVRDLTLAPWSRTGGEAAFINLDGMEAKWGMYLVQVPGRGELKPERHLYEELFYVVEGRGSTEVWQSDGAKRQTFEWQPGTLFSVPMNAWHRLLNGSSGPSLVLVATTAPQAINLFDNDQFVFDNPFRFGDRYDGREQYFKVNQELEEHPGFKRAMLRSAVIPDIANCYLPLDNQRAPGFRWVTPVMADNREFNPFIAEYPAGRYSKGHYHSAGAVLICLRGKGYTYTWPSELGTHPWEDGNAGQVRRQDYVPGGLVSAAPGKGNWFHQHFGVAKDVFRVFKISTGKPWLTHTAETEAVWGNADMEEGGHSIPYWAEDPYIRREFEEATRQEGGQFTMPDGLFHQTPFPPKA